jgi:hypothetical protein
MSTSASLIKKYGRPQITPNAANVNHAFQLTRHSPDAKVHNVPADGFNHSITK